MMLDKTDRILLTLLKENAKLKYSELGERVHLSAPAVHERVKKMERAGVIRKYSIDIDPEALGLPIQAFLRVHLSQVPCEETARLFGTIPEVVECFSSASEESMLLKVHVRSPAQLEELINHIRLLPGVERLLTSVLLKTHFQRENFLVDH